ncbi:hypothetical protein NQ317_004307 [Molorchus minor]|uniref:N-acetyltransferase domain-containing protein n=1 Tax=Molorchus minor TaxID=1323400 RepID=A0ABQ9JYN1_9CUCU|nr:hypothetical protein NQ317_004307 [Molorchus minor]
MCEKYPKELGKDMHTFAQIAGGVRESISYFHEFKDEIYVSSPTHPSSMICSLLPSVMDQSVSKRFVTCLLAALRANGSFGVHVVMNITDNYTHAFYGKLGFVENTHEAIKGKIAIIENNTKTKFVLKEIHWKLCKEPQKIESLHSIGVIRGQQGVEIATPKLSNNEFFRPDHAWRASSSILGMWHTGWLGEYRCGGRFLGLVMQASAFGRCANHTYLQTSPAAIFFPDPPIGSSVDLTILLSRPYSCKDEPMEGWGDELIFYLNLYFILVNEEDSPDIYGERYSSVWILVDYFSNPASLFVAACERNHLVASLNNCLPGRASSDLSYPVLCLAPRGFLMRPGLLINISTVVYDVKKTTVLVAENFGFKELYQRMSPTVIINLSEYSSSSHITLLLKILVGSGRFENLEAS